MWRITIGNHSLILLQTIGNHSLILLQTTEYYKRELEMNPYQTLEQLWRLDDS